MNLHEEILAALIHIGANGPTDGNYGICYEVHVLIEQKYDGKPWDFEHDEEIDEILADLMAKWPKHSGDRVYPIPAPNGQTKPGAYFWATMHGKTKWDAKSKQGQLRWGLLQFCITELSKGE